MTATFRTMFMSVAEMIEERAREFPDEEVVAVPDKNFTFHRYTYRDLDQASTKLAHHYVKSGLRPREKGDDQTKMTVALLMPSGLEYVVNEIALAKMGYCVLFLSINNSIPALAHLIKITSTVSIVVHPTLQAAADEALTLLREEKLDCAIVPNAPASVWENSDAAEPFVRALSPDQEGPLPVFCVHSSGSTGFPKPIFLTNKASCHNFGRGGFGLTAFTTLPLFHNHGHSCLWRAICGRTLLCLFPSEIPLTTQNVNKALANAGPVQGLYVVPYVLKLLAESEEGISLLQSFKLVTYGGAACPDELGDKLVKTHGVRLAGHYGSTEVGQLATSFRDFDTDKDWNYVRFEGPLVPTNIAQYLHLDPQGENLVEVVVKDGWGGKVVTNRPDGSYATKDLFVAHPTINGAYKFKGRIDDTVVHVNGEKTNPVPLELTLKGESPYISEAIVFGDGQPHTGALILPTELAKNMSPAQLFPLIWPIVEIANEEAPTHSRLQPEMLIYLPYDTTLPRADKGSVIRPRTYAQFADTIKELYERYDAGEAKIPGQETTKRSLRGDELATFVTSVISDVTGTEAGELDTKTDLFDFGVNSIQSARIRNVLQREIQLNGTRLPGNLVFERPTVEQLCKYLEKVQDGEIGGDEFQDVQIAKMKELLSKYTDFTKRSAASEPVKGKRTYLLTGATGSLGAHLARSILEHPDTDKLICLVRGNNDADAEKRVLESLKTRGIEGVDTSSLVCYPSNLSEPDLGLGERFNQVQETVTTIIHNGWAVNFTLNVESFEKGNILPTFNLLNLAITARQGQSAEFFFSSSVSAVAAHKGRTIAEVVSNDPLDAQGMGYARSKWVTENMVSRAAVERRIRANSFRIGQMVGDTERGVWNETEAISLLIKSAQTIGAMPDLKETLSWLPVNLSASACLEIIQSGAGDPGSVWHVLNASQATTWETVHSALRTAGIKFDVVPPKGWVDRLANSDRNVERNPTYKLLDFFASKYNTDAPARRAEYLTEKTGQASTVVAGQPNVDEAVVGKFIAAWRRTGFLQ